MSVRFILTKGSIKNEPKETYSIVQLSFIIIKKWPNGYYFCILSQIVNELTETYSKQFFLQ